MKKGRDQYSLYCLLILFNRIMKCTANTKFVLNSKQLLFLIIKVIFGRCGHTNAKKLWY